MTIENQRFTWFLVKIEKMNIIEELYAHKFLEQICIDNPLSTLKKKSSDDLPTEIEFYKGNVLFYTTHLIDLIGQINDAVELLSNYNYTVKMKNIGRGKHLTYNIENYTIRINSLLDRILQTINATFHLGIDERHVNEKVVVRNLKVTTTEIPNHFDELKKYLNEKSRNRNIIIHRHSIIDDELFRLQKLYHPEFTSNYLNKSDEKDIEELKYLRKDFLTRYVKKKRKEFYEINETCFKKVITIFDLLLIKYNSVKIEIEQK